MIAIHFVVPGKPEPKARARVFTTSKGETRAATPKNTKGYEQFVGLKCNLAMRGQKPAVGAVAVDIDVALAIPASWSGKKREAALAGVLRPTSKPDVDNIAKSVTDGMNRIAYFDDAQITQLVVRKAYAQQPQVVVTLRELA